MNREAEGAGEPHAHLFASYRQAAGAHDEAVDSSGNVRPHWLSFIKAMNAAGLSGYAASSYAVLADRLNRQARESGIAHDVFAGRSAPAQRWKIDPIPLIISPDQWSWLETALPQRARLLDAILSDAYGSQTLLQSGKIPPQLLFSDPAFLTPLVGHTGQGAHLRFYAADLARGPDGSWRVLDNHAETTAGLGFALANRVAHSNVMGGAFRRCGGVRLAPFMQKLQADLLAGSRRDDPAVALLTPGQHSEDHFGFSYLARYLGFMMVEGGDLRVLGSSVYMKTLEGLRPIDLIIRCVQGSACDPLELEPWGFLGPAGFTQAARAHPGLIHNPLGAGLLENRGLGRHLAALAPELLGEELLLHDAPRTWLGEAAARRDVLRRLDRMVIRPVREGPGRPGNAAPGLRPAAMSGAELDQLRERIELEGHALVAEEPLVCATLPSWTSRGVRPRPYAVRLFVARIGHEFKLMPGGLALTGKDEYPVALSARNGAAHDVWVTAAGETSSQLSLLRPALEAAIVQRRSKGVPSRIADNLFWLGRYCERADWIMRLMRSALHRLENAGPAQDPAPARRAIELLLGKDQGLTQLLRGDEAPGALEHLVTTLLSSPGRAYGLRGALENVHRTSSLIRDRLSVELWQTLQVFHESEVWRGEKRPRDAAETLDYLNQGVTMLAAFNGMAAENMTRSHGWRFLDMGRRLERAFNLSELLLTLFGEARGDEEETGGLLFVLEVADSILTFRSRYLFSPMLALALDLLLIDETNPRGVAFQLAAISRHLEALPQASEGRIQTEEQRLILSLLTRVRLARVLPLAGSGGAGERSEFRALFTELNTDLPKLSEAVTRRYFSLTEDGLKRVHTRLG